METTIATATATTAAATGINYNKTPRPGVLIFARRAGGIFQYAACIERAFERFSLEQSGYKRFTSFANDFAIAECFGDGGIKDTFRRALAAWKKDYKYLTELEMVLNWLCWFWYENKEDELSALYSELYYAARNKFYEIHGKNEEAVTYHFDCTD